MKLNSRPYTKLSLTQSMTDRQTGIEGQKPPSSLSPINTHSKHKNWWYPIWHSSILKVWHSWNQLVFFMILSNLLKSFTLILTRTRCWGQYNADYLELGPTFTGTKIFYQIHVQTIMSIMIYIVSLYCILIKSLLRL